MQSFWQLNIIFLCPQPHSFQTLKWQIHVSQVWIYIPIIKIIGFCPTLLFPKPRAVCLFISLLEFLKYFKIDFWKFSYLNLINSVVYIKYCKPPQGWMNLFERFSIKNFVKRLQWKKLFKNDGFLKEILIYKS